MLADIIDVLADPIDGTALTDGGQWESLVSESGHVYPVAPEGFVTLSGPYGLRYTGDDDAMINARERFLASGHFGQFVEAVTGNVQDALDDAEVAEDAHPVIMEVGAGTGYYLSHTLDGIPGARGIGLDVSTAAARRLVNCHPRVGTVLADAWSRLPIKSGSIDVITVVFAPRNAEEFARVLTDKGQVVVMTPEAGHLTELRERLGIVDVESHKVERMIEQAAGHLKLAAEPELVEFPMTLGQKEIAAQIEMSPSARHIRPEYLQQRVRELPETMTIKAKAMVTRLQKA